MNQILKFFTTSVILLLQISILISCNSKQNSKPSDEDYILTIKGSDTEFEMVKKLCENFQSIDTLKYKIEGGGTELGFKALINGDIQMATASREISDKEINLLKKNNINTIAIMFATDALAIITHPRLGVDSLTLQQLSAIYKGEIKNWKQVGGPDWNITIYTRDLNSGTNSYFRNKVTHGEFIQSAKTCNNSHEIVDSVSKDSTGIGYTGTGFIMDREGKPSNKIWAMPISIDNKHYAYSPYQTAEVKNGNYPLSRPLYQYYCLPIHPKVKTFILYELGLKGLDLITHFGYFPINDYQKEINKLAGLNL